MLAALHSCRAENERNAVLDQRMRHLEIGRAEEAETDPRAIAGKVGGDDRGHVGIDAHNSLPPAGAL